MLFLTEFLFNFQRVVKTIYFCNSYKAKKRHHENTTPLSIYFQNALWQTSILTDRHVLKPETPNRNYRKTGTKPSEPPKKLSNVIRTNVFFFRIIAHFRSEITRNEVLYGCRSLNFRRTPHGRCLASLARSSVLCFLLCLWPKLETPRNLKNNSSSLLLLFITSLFKCLVKAHRLTNTG